MKVKDFKTALNSMQELKFTLNDGVAVPNHIHVTEIGQIDKRFMDCGGTVRTESVVSIQLWEGEDFWHRLTPEKLGSVLDMAVTKLGIPNLEVEVEYQTSTIGKFGIELVNGQFMLTTKATNCLAQELCVLPLGDSNSSSSKCAPNSGCC